MNRLAALYRLTTVAATVLVACAVLVFGVRWGSPKAEAALHAVTDAAQVKQDNNPETRVFYGVSSCKNCHTKGYEDPDSFICRGTEIPIWQKEDKHGLAHIVLGGQRAQHIGKILGWDVKNKKECLTCHAVWVEDKPGIAKAGNFSLAEGVSCVACHGANVIILPGKDKPYKLGWVDTHGAQDQVFREAWRKLPRSKKQDEEGMNDLWDPVKRTRLCASCHIGNVGQSKVVTHEMYAAGHPPLPSFEVVTFSNQMPRHWQYLREKPENIRKQVMGFQPSEVNLEQVHLLAIGGLVAFGENMRLLAEQADTKDWPELANYSCYACHHELKPKSWRQDRGYAGKPGRPTIREWSTALVELGLFHAAGDDAAAAKKLIAGFQGRLAALQSVVDAQPFGHPEGVKQKADELRKWIDDQVAQIGDRIQQDEKKGGYVADTSAKLLAQLLEWQQRSHPDAKVNAALKRVTPDYDSARQLAWAYQVLYLETVSKHDPAVRDQLAKAMGESDAWKGLDGYLGLNLPHGRVELETSILRSMERIGQFEPRQYFQQMDAVLKQFKGP